MIPSTMLEAEKVEMVINEFAEFKIPYPSFAGGRFQTKICFYFGHVDADGKLAKVEVAKPGGSKYFYKIT